MGGPGTCIFFGGGGLFVAFAPTQSAARRSTVVALQD